MSIVSGKSNTISEIITINLKQNNFMTKSLESF